MRATHRHEPPATSHGPEPTAAVADIGRNGKYISSRAKSPLHTPRVAAPGRAFDSNEPWPPPRHRLRGIVTCDSVCDTPTPHAAHAVSRHTRTARTATLPVYAVPTYRQYLTYPLPRTFFRCNFRFFSLASRKSRGKINMLKPDPKGPERGKNIKN